MLLADLEVNQIRLINTFHLIIRQLDLFILLEGPCECVLMVLLGVMTHAHALLNAAVCRCQHNPSCFETTFSSSFSIVFPFLLLLLWLLPSSSHPQRILHPMQPLSLCVSVCVCNVCPWMLYLATLQWITHPHTRSRTQVTGQRGVIWWDEEVTFTVSRSYGPVAIGYLSYLLDRLRRNYEENDFLVL